MLQLLAVRGQAVVRHLAVDDDAAEVPLAEFLGDERDDRVARALQRTRRQVGRVEDEDPGLGRLGAKGAEGAGVLRVLVLKVLRVLRVLEVQPS